MGQKGTDPPDTTGVELTFTIQPSVPLEIKALSVAEVEAKQREEEAAAKKRQADEAAAAKRQADEAAAKKLQEDEAAALAAKKLQEEAARKRHLTKARNQCKKIEPGKKRARCMKRANNKFGARAAGKNPY